MYEHEPGAFAPGSVFVSAGTDAAQAVSSRLTDRIRREAGLLATKE